MVKEINLLKQESKDNKNQQQIVKYINILSPLALLLFAVLVAAVYSFSLVQTTKANDINKKLEETQNLIESLSETESYHRGVKLKLVAVKKILSEQVNYSKVLSQLQEVAPPEINYTSLSVTSDKTIEVSYKAANSDQVQALINSLIDPKIGGKYFEQIKLKNLLYSRDGSYLISLTFRLKM